MKKLLYRPDGKIRRFIFWVTFILVLAAVYFVFGGFIGWIDRI